MSRIRTSSNQINWYPFANQADATINLCQFTNLALGPDFGVVFCDSTAVCLLRLPSYDAQGIGYSVIIQYHLDNVAPQTHLAPPDFLDRVENFVEARLADYGRAQIAQSEMVIQADQALASWLSNPTHEHEIGLAFDILGLVSFALLFVPGIGEAEMGLFAAFRAAMAANNYLRATGLFTALIGGTGALAGTASDGRFLYERFAVGREAAEKWDQSNLAQGLSTAAFLLSLPDLAVGSTLMIRDLPELSGGIAKADAQARVLSDHAAALSARAGQIDATAGRSGDDAVSQRVGKVTAYARERAKTLTKQAAEMNTKAVKLTRKLYVTLMVNGTANVVGSPTMDAYFLHDAHENYLDHRSGIERSFWQYLAPHPQPGPRLGAKYGVSFHIAASRRPTHR